MKMNRLAIVIPCYNEERRFPVGDLRAFLKGAPASEISFILVDDGSQDQTYSLMENLHGEFPDKIVLLRFNVNQGKAEAVRQGVLKAFEMGFSEGGYWDADGATSWSQIHDLHSALLHRNVLFVLGSRVKILGRKIERKIGRHYSGRIFATMVSLVLRIPIYDSQCGAKVFKLTPRLKRVLSEKFLSRWAFDVELLGRLLYGGTDSYRLQDFLESPLESWKDPGGSKLSFFQMLKTTFELIRIERDLRQRRIVG